MIVTIDGSAGSGKSTAAKALARALGYDLLNTGAMYRAAAVALRRAGVDLYADPRDVSAVAELVAAFTFDMPAGRVILSGTDFTDAITTREAGDDASRVGTFAEVRERLKAEQRRIADARKIVCEGRDQGTAVFPDAPVKFFFFASAEVRAERRVAQLQAAGQTADYAVVLRGIRDRDRQDSERPLDPLRKAADAVEIDTSHIDEAEVLRRMLEAVDLRRS